jgi:hypothetical protein
VSVRCVCPHCGNLQGNVRGHGMMAHLPYSMPWNDGSPTLQYAAYYCLQYGAWALESKKLTETETRTLGPLSDLSPTIDLQYSTTCPTAHMDTRIPYLYPCSRGLQMPMALGIKLPDGQIDELFEKKLKIEHRRHWDLDPKIREKATRGNLPKKHKEFWYAWFDVIIESCLRKHYPGCTVTFMEMTPTVNRARCESKFEKDMQVTDQQAVREHLWKKLLNRKKGLQMKLKNKGKRGQDVHEHVGGPPGHDGELFLRELDARIPVNGFCPATVTNNIEVEPLHDCPGAAILVAATHQRPKNNRVCDSGRCASGWIRRELADYGEMPHFRVRDVEMVVNIKDPPGRRLME